MSLYVHTGGTTAAGPAVVFLHGAALDHTVWRFQTRWLAHRGHRVVAPDLPGHGRSLEPIRHSIEEWADWLIDFASGMAPAVLVGHSMGGLMAIEAAARRPQLVAGMVLVGTIPQMQIHPQLMSSAEANSPLAAELFAGWSFPTGYAGGHPEPGTWQPGGTERLVRRSPEDVLAIDLAACAAFDATGPARAVSVPTLVVIGKADRMTPPRMQREMAGLIPGSEVVEMEGVGHETMLQRPREFNRVLAAFLDRVGKNEVG